MWWIAGLWAQSGYGLNILKFTETLRVVSLSSLPSEVLRGLGYWFFYGIDRVGHWTDASVPYTQNLGLLVVSFAIPVLALFGAACVRWRHRAYFVVLTVVGVVVAVGANPYDDPSVARRHCSSRSPSRRASGSRCAAPAARCRWSRSASRCCSAWR